MRKRKTKYKAGGVVLSGKMGTHSSSLFVFRDLSKAPAIGTSAYVCRLDKFEGTYYLGDRDWDHVKIDDVFSHNEGDPLADFVVMHLI